ncbi:MAG: DUF1670 domain-containing protein [Chloroflexi bacterium]|nr:DUF1670 domain-containing protein [Chloroflexota bacterium]MBU1748447.1 DUF1670 domain-containing protein [Chloroflexota bacterium]
MEQNAVDRLANKSLEAAIIDQISRDFHLAPFMARTYFEQMQGYFEQYLNQQRDVGQMTFLAVRASTPPGRALSECERIAITLTLDSADDLEALRHNARASTARPWRCAVGVSAPCGGARSTG